MYSFKILNSQKLSCLVGLFGLKSFHGFISLAQLEDVTDCLFSVLSCIIVLLFMAGSIKNIQKASICSNKNTQEELNNITYILRSKHISFLPPPTPFLKTRIKFRKNSVGGEIFQENQNGIGFFHFHFLTISRHDNGTTFRKSSIGKLFIEKIFPGTSKNWSYHTDLLVFCLKI